MENLSFSPAGNRVVSIDPEQSMLCKIDANGFVEYINAYYMSFSEYDVTDIIGKTALELKHKDFPVTVFNHIMQHLLQKKNINVLVKDQTKSGNYYWYMTNFFFKTDNKGDILSFYSYRQVAPEYINPELITLYNKLLKMEQYTELKVAQNYFDGFLEEIQMSFEEYTHKLIAKTSNINNQNSEVDDFFIQKTQSKKKGYFTNLFGG